MLSKVNIGQFLPGTALGPPGADTRVGIRDV